ncbi:hypothetical protein L1987_66866 [Smallanthus sonchifolius]|uniref:Uncharacterized protein n=1 Tax=Smallanthus sonchifolius TaxID=185202 RepID=A0ACB9BYH5_9ASTR|nr:hypothetical protein L1987_66866 [Smallanthus sonchifolius]
MAVDTANIGQFEFHAASANKRPREHMYLDNGNTLREVLNTCKTASLEGMEETILKGNSSSSKEKPTFCLKCKGSIPIKGRLCFCVIRAQAKKSLTLIPVLPNDIIDMYLLL